MNITSSRSILFSVVIVLAGCGIDGAPPVPNDVPPAPSNAVVKVFFEENRKTLDSFVQFCNLNPAVRWLGADSGQIDFVRGQQGINIEEAEVVQQSLRQLGIRSINCNRDWRLDKPPLLGVWVPLYGVGLSVSGSSKGFRYSTKPKENYEAKLASGEYVSLGVDRWYIVTN